MRLRLISSSVLVCGCLAWSSVSAATKEPRIGYLYPAGGRSGSTFEMTVGGQFLKGATNVLVSGSGVDVTVLQYVKAITNKERNELRKKMRETQKSIQNAQKKGQPQPKMEVMDPESWPMDPRDLDVSEMSASDLKKLRSLLFNPKKQPNAQLDDRVLLSVKIASDAKPGKRELRLLTSRGLSNPVILYVNTFAEQYESEPNEKDATRVVSLPVVLNGQIMPGDVDRFRFHAKRGQRLIANVQARALLPYLADTVPGWFQAVLTLYDADGKELVFVDDFRFDPDPLLRFEVPADGDYELLIRDSIYRGREDFVYRIALGELPFVERAFPIGGRVGETTRVSLQGWNLPTRTLVVDGAKMGPGIHQVAPGSMAGSRPVMFALDALSEILDSEPNNSPTLAQPITLPVTINGTISKSGDWDVFCFKGKKGENISAEVFARRLNSPLDSMLKLSDNKGHQLGSNDDERDEASGLTTHHADSHLLATLPADGTYYVHIGDSQNAGGDAYGYRLRLGDSKPEFGLRVMPPSINMYAGDTVRINVVAIRRDGFGGDINLELKDAPAGVVLSGGRVPAGQDKVVASLTIPRDMPTGVAVPLRIEGVAEVAGCEVHHDAVAAEDMMQAFLWRHLVPVEELMLVCMPRKWSRPPVRLTSDVPVAVGSGESAAISFRVKSKRMKSDLEFELTHAPEGVTLGNVTPVKGGVDITLIGDQEKLVSGQKGNLQLSAFMQQAVRGKDKKPTVKTRRVLYCLLPSVPFEVVDK